MSSVLSTISRAPTRTRNGERCALRRRVKLPLQPWAPVGRQYCFILLALCCRDSSLYHSSRGVSTKHFSAVPSPSHGPLSMTQSYEYVHDSFLYVISSATKAGHYLFSCSR